MKFLTLYLLLTFSLAFMPGNFKTKQQQFPRVKTAYKEKEQTVKDMFSSRGLQLGAEIFIRAFKKEAQLEVWARPNASPTESFWQGSSGLAKGKAENAFKLIKTYGICSSSGALGPKRKQGDYQVPEGFYEINCFNPSSNFYLSLGLNYPNRSDKILGKGNPGGDIFIHGSCVTIGCIPLTDDKIMEVYLMAVEARSAGQQKIPVHVFPCRMNDMGIRDLEKINPGLIPFWKNIQTGYEFFEEKKALPAVSVLPSGEYSFK